MLDTVKNLVLGAARKHRAEFEKIVGGFEDRGIPNSEMLAVCSIAEELGAEVFIESGRWKGQSTEILAQYFTGKQCIVESVELYRDANAVHVEEKMKGYNNLVLHYGDANQVLPAIVRKHRSKKIVILLDGPKGREALDVFQFCLTQSENIVAGFFHDMRRSSPGMITYSRDEMEHVFPHSFYTDDTQYVEEFSILDQGCVDLLWAPYKIDGKKIGSYGPTIGLTLPAEDDFQRASRKKIPLFARLTKRRLFYIGVKSYQTLRRVFDYQLKWYLKVFR